MATLGQKLLNPLAVKTPSSGPWDGQTGKDNRGHAIFDDARWGIRAGCKILSRYYRERGARTLNDIFRIYAPASDTVGSIPGNPGNQPNKYAAYVAGRIGIGPDTPCGAMKADGTVGSRAMLEDMLIAMAYFESLWKIDRDIVSDGIDLFIGHDGPTHSQPTGATLLYDSRGEFISNAAKEFQKFLNTVFGAGLKVDGWLGTKSSAAAYAAFGRYLLGDPRD